MLSVSVIIPTYKRGRVLAQTLPSYLAQKHVSEVVIVDDGGFAKKDLTAFLNHPKIRYFAPPRRLGLPGGRNYGIGKGKNDLIVFGEDDVEFAPGYVARLIETMRATGADIVGGRQIFVYHNETRAHAMKQANRLTERDLYLVFPTDVNFSVDLGRDIELHTLLPFALFKRAVFDSVRYDERIAGNYHREETDLYVSALEHGFKIVFCHSAFVWHLTYLSRSGGCRTGKQIEIEYALLRNNIYFWRKHYRFLKERLGLRGPFLFYALKYSAARYVQALRRVF